MSEYVIETGVEIPAPKQFATRPLKYPLDIMEVGQSFAVPMTAKSSIRVALQNFKKRETGRKFVTRTLADEGVIRVWRTE